MKILLTFFFFASFSSASAALQVHMGNGTIGQGRELLVPVTVTNFQDVLTMQFTMSFDPNVLHFLGTVDYGLPNYNASKFGTSLAHEGLITTVWFNSFGHTSADGTTLFQMRFLMVGSQSDQSSFDLAAGPTPLEFVDSSFQPIDVIFQPGHITNNDACRKGDIDQNSAVNTDDVRALLDRLSNLTHGAPLGDCESDVSCNGAITAYDAALIQRRLVDPAGHYCQTIDATSASLHIEDRELTLLSSSFLYPVYVSDFETLSAVRFTCNYDGQTVQFTNILGARGDWSFSVNQNQHSIEVAGIATEPITEDGVLFYLEAEIQDSGVSEIVFEDVMLNESWVGHASATITVGECDSWDLFLDSLPQWSANQNILTMIPFLNCADGRFAE